MTDYIDGQTLALGGYVLGGTLMISGCHFPEGRYMLWTGLGLIGATSLGLGIGGLIGYDIFYNLKNKFEKIKRNKDSDLEKEIESKEN